MTTNKNGITINEKNKSLKFDMLNYGVDKGEIMTWEYLFKDSKELKKIKKYVLENNFLSLSDFIDKTYKSFLKRSDYPAFLTCKNENNEIVGLIAVLLYDVGRAPKLTIRYILTRPDKQHTGVANFMLSNVANYIDNLGKVKISMVNANVNRGNKEGINLFTKLGFESNHNYSKNFVSFEKDISAPANDSDYPKSAPFVKQRI